MSCKGPKFTWTIAPCFFLCHYRFEEKKMSEADKINIIRSVSFLQTKNPIIKIAVDDHHKFLLDQYNTMDRFRNDVSVHFLFKQWLRVLSILVENESDSIEYIELTKDKLNENRDKLDNASKYTPELATCLIKCITICRGAKNHFLLTNQSEAMRDDKIDKTFDIKLFNCEEAYKRIEGLQNPKEIQEYLMKESLRNIRKKLQKNINCKLYYNNKKVPKKVGDNTRYKIERIPKKEPEVANHILSELENEVLKTYLKCSYPVGAEDGIADAMVSNDHGAVIIEVKYAHSKDLKNGLVNQLPGYLEKTKYGIYMVLYCSSDEISFQDRQIELEKIREKYAVELKKYKIEIFWIDLSIKTPPSKRKANFVLN